MTNKNIREVRAEIDYIHPYDWSNNITVTLVNCSNNEFWERCFYALTQLKKSIKTYLGTFLNVQCPCFLDGKYNNKQPHHIYKKKPHASKYFVYTSHFWGNLFYKNIKHSPFYTQQ